MSQEKEFTALVLCHSNTGNTAGLAKEAAAALEEQGWKVHQFSLDRALKDLPKEKPDLLLVGTPIHFWQVPVPALEVIKKLPRFDGTGAFVFQTYGTVFDGDAPYQLAKAVADRGARILGGASILAPHNFKINPTQRLGDAHEDFGKGLPDAQVLADFRSAVKAVAAKVENNVRGFDIYTLRSSKPVLTFVDGLMPISMQRNLLPKVQWAEEVCTQCGKCVKACTTGSISESDGEIITNHSTCYRCYQCLWECKSQARSADLAGMAKMLRGLKKVVKNPGNRFFT